MRSPSYICVRVSRILCPRFTVFSHHLQVMAFLRVANLCGFHTSNCCHLPGLSYITAGEKIFSSGTYFTHTFYYAPISKSHIGLGQDSTSVEWIEHVGTLSTLGIVQDVLIIN